MKILSRRETKMLDNRVGIWMLFGRRREEQEPAWRRAGHETNHGSRAPQSTIQVQEESLDTDLNGVAYIVPGLVRMPSCERDIDQTLY